MSTANIELLTGLPGAGKTLRMVARIRKELQAGAQVYVCNIPELKIHGVIPWEDPLQWQDLPAGSILVVDEAQEFFPARRSGDPSPQVKALSKIRHTGVRLLLVTQQPSYLEAYVRGLVGRHEHLLRKDGAAKSYVFRQNEVFSDPSSLRARVKSDTETFRFPVEEYASYKSAEIHTMKYQMSARTKRAIVLGIAGVVCLVGGVSVFGYDFTKSKSSTSAAAAPGAAPLAERAGLRPVGSKQAPMTREEYARQLVPRIANQPWSAPIFDGRSVASEPNLVCISSDDSCTCMTEQATVYPVKVEECAFIARHGPAYNPYKAAEPKAAVVDQVHVPATASAAEVELLHAAPIARAQSAPTLGAIAPGDPRRVGSPGMGLVQGR